MSKKKAQTELVECDSCQKTFDPNADGSRQEEVYQPFDENAYSTFHYCPECANKCDDPEESFYCDHCNRQIWSSNGMRNNEHYIQEDEKPWDKVDTICAKCFQEIAFEHGQPTSWAEGSKIGCEWYDDADLQAHGFVRVIQHRFIAGSDSARRFNEEARAKYEHHYVITSITTCGMGIEGTVDLWIKPKENQGVKDEPVSQKQEIQEINPADIEHSAI